MTKKWERNPPEVQSGFSFISAALSSCCPLQATFPSLSITSQSSSSSSERTVLFSAWQRAGQLEDSAKEDESGDKGPT